MSRLTVWIIVGVLAACGGCLSVKTPDVHVEVLHPWRSTPSEPYTPYGQALQRVIRQQATVTEELQDSDWEDLLEEADDWVEYVRTLSGYAHTSHDPDRFRSYCDQLLRETQALRHAAKTYDADECHRAIDACDPLLDEFSRTFPITAPAAQRARKEQNSSNSTRVP